MLEAANLWHSSANRLSLSAVQRLFTTFCIVTVIRGTSDVLTRIRCSCILFGKHGRCAHQSLTAFLEGHIADQFTDLREQTKRNPQTAMQVCGRIERKQYSRAALPSATAWRKAADIAAQAAEKYKKRKAVTKSEAIDCTPPSKQAKTDEDSPAAKRKLEIENIKAKLSASDFHSQFSGLHGCLSSEISLQEAKDWGIGFLVNEVKKKSKQGTVLKLADRLLESWLEVARSEAASPAAKSNASSPARVGASASLPASTAASASSPRR